MHQWSSDLVPIFLLLFLGYENIFMGNFLYKNMKGKAGKCQT